jgi:hypothetical protein
VGAINGAIFPIILLRALLMGAVFFAIAAFVNFVVNHFLPELLEPPQEEDMAAPGSRLNIMEDEPTPNLFNSGDDDDNELGNISDLVGGASILTERSAKAGAGNPVLNDGGMDFSAMDNAMGFEAEMPPSHSMGMDQKGKDGYTVKAEGAGDFAAAKAATPRAVMPDSADSVDVLPDMDSMAGAFLDSSGEDEKETVTEYGGAPSPRKVSTGGKSQAMGGDFNPKELAMGLRTILKKED